MSLRRELINFREKKVHWFGKKIQEFEILSSFLKKEITNYKNFTHLRNKKEMKKTQKMLRFSSVVFQV